MSESKGTDLSSFLQNLPELLEQHDREMDELARVLETKGKIGKLLMLRANPDLKGYLEYRAAQQSIVDARRHAQREAHTIFIS